MFSQQPKEIARQVMRAMDQREAINKVNVPVYDGDLSWKKVSSGSEYDITLKYQPGDQDLNSALAVPSKKLNII